MIIEVSDGFLTASATITINLNDVNETVNQAPVISDQTFSIDENSANGTVVGNVQASDPDGDILTYSISAGNSLGAFAINTLSGEITVADESKLDFETNPTFNLAIEVTDGLLKATAIITIRINDLNENELSLHDAIKINAYPNPVINQLRLDVGAELVGFQVQIVGMSGVILKSTKLEKENYLNLASFPAGVYLVRIDAGGQIIQHKITKMD